ncbi:MAG: FtsX-like permease family protein [Deltaproteobacteria bacterium]
MAISEGVKAESMASVMEGADIYLTLDQYGKNAPVPLKYLPDVKKINGVMRVVPRVLGRTYLGDSLAVVVGIPAGELPPSVECVEGKPFSSRGEAVIGVGLARHFNFSVGHAFMLGGVNGRMLKITGLFKADSSIWASDLIFIPFEDASAIFKTGDLATDFLIYVRPGYTSAVAETLKKIEGASFRIQSKELVKQYFNKGFTLKGGIFTALYTVAFALAIPALLVSSGFGLSERKREIGIFKATGWQTSEVLEMVVFENLIISLSAAPLALLISFLWLKGLNGLFIAQFFIAEIGLFPPFNVPARFLPIPAFLSFFFSLILTMVGSLYSSWRAAVIPPAEAMK